MRYNFKYNIYKRVPANSTVEEIMTPCVDCTLEIDVISGTAPYQSNCSVELLFGTDIIFTTHGDKTDSTGFVLYGSAGISIYFRFINTSTNEETMGLTIAGNISE